MIRRIAPVLFIFALASVGAARGEEGMWTFDNVPAARVQSALGVRLDHAWLDRLRLASVRLTSGCSAAVVSREGLMLTNQHCVLACAQALSTADHDYVADGFLTDARAEERTCPGVEAEVLEAIEDVTGELFAASAGKFGEAFVLARENAIARAERRACGRDRRLRCQVISFFGGGAFKVYRYRQYDDVRLVFSPEFAAAFFGGEADNFSFPRYAFDCAFLRLYERSRPAATPRALTFAPHGPAEGQAVFVSGNPGLTERGAALAELETERDTELPAIEASRAALRARLVAFAEASADNRRLVGPLLFETDNALDIVRGRLGALRDPAFIAARAADEAALKAKVAADPKLAAAIGDPWAQAGEIQKRAAAEFAPWRELENDAGHGSQLFAWGRLLVRGAAERIRPNALRLPEFADQRLALDRKLALDPRPAPPALERLVLTAWLSQVADDLGPTVYASLSGGLAPAALAERLAASGLSDPGLRRAVWDGGAAAVAASDDPMIAFVLRIDAVSRAERQAYEDDVEGPTQRTEESIARARFATLGETLYPDATFSLRFSWGRVAGWGQGQGAVAPFTTLDGLYRRAGEAGALPPRWLAARSRLAGDTVFDFATTNDITGGSSGSPVVDAAGEVVGAAFDGNRASIAGEFAYDGAQNRTVAVSSAAIAEALDKVYGRAALIRELGGASTPPRASLPR